MEISFATGFIPGLGITITFGDSLKSAITFRADKTTNLRLNPIQWADSPLQCNYLTLFGHAWSFDLHSRAQCVRADFNNRFARNFPSRECGSKTVSQKLLLFPNETFFQGATSAVVFHCGFYSVIPLIIGEMTGNSRPVNAVERTSNRYKDSQHPASIPSRPISGYCTHISGKYSTIYMKKYQIVAYEISDPERFIFMKHFYNLIMN